MEAAESIGTIILNIRALKSCGVYSGYQNLRGSVECKEYLLRSLIVWLCNLFACMPCKVLFLYYYRADPGG